MTTRPQLTGVNVYDGPIGAYGWRTGYWTASLDDGTTFRFYSSVQTLLSSMEQERRLLRDAQSAAGGLSIATKTEERLAL